MYDKQTKWSVTSRRMKHKYEHKKFLICWNMTLAAVRNISPYLQPAQRSAALRAAVLVYISSASPSHFIFLRALLPQEAKLPALICQSSCAINRPVLETLQSLSCLAHSTGIQPWYSPENHRTSTRRQSFSTVEDQSVIFSEQTLQPRRISQIWLCFLRNQRHRKHLFCTRGVFTVTCMKEDNISDLF